MEDIERQWSRKTRYLTQALILSVTLNVGLLVTFSIQAIRANSYQAKPLVIRSGKTTSRLSNTDILKDYFSYSFYALLDELKDDTLVEDGFRKRDFALSCLADFHYLDIERALAGINIQRRKILFIHSEGKEEVKLTVFPGLEPKHFDAIVHFVKTEKWPVTPEGLFLELSSNSEYDTSLYDAFALSDHFQLVHKLFSRSGYSLATDDLIDLLKEGEFNYLDRFTQAQLKSVDLSARMLDSFIFQYLRFQSGKMAQFVIENERHDLVRRMDDDQLIGMIDSLDQMGDEVDAFLKQMLMSVRSDQVRQAAGLKLFGLTEAEPPSPYDHNTTISHFLPQVVKNEPKKVVRLTQQLREHTVESGDSLWLIAKKYGVSIDDILEENHLKSKHRLKIGMKLAIP